MKMPKFTFKKEPPLTGLLGVGHPWPNTIIRLDKKDVGFIQAPTWQTKDHMWRVWLRVIDTGKENPNCNWRNARMKAKFTTEPEARAWLNENVEKLIALGLHAIEETEG